MAKEYFRHGLFRVTGNFIKARNRSIKLEQVESVELSRPLFLFALASGGSLAATGLVYGDLLYTGEIIGAVAFGVLMFVLAWNVGTLKVYTKLTGAKGWAVTWWHRPLRSMRTAIEEALEARHAARRAARRAGGGAATDEDDEDEDDET